MPGQLAAPAPAAPPADPNQVIATIGDDKITVAQFDSIVGGLPQQYQAQARGPAKRQFMEQLVQLKLLSKEAQKLNLEQKPEVQQQLSFTRENILANAAAKNIMDNTKVSDADVHKYYDDHKNDYQTAQAHHILIRFKGSGIPVKEGQKDLTEEEALAKAQDIVKQLKAGGDFAAIAKAESADTGSGEKGGDLGAPFTRTQMVKPFADAAFSLPPGQISDPVKSQYGYHVIRVDKVDTKSFEDVKGEIEAKLKPEMAKKKIDDLTKSANVKLDDGFFGPAPMAAGPPTLQNAK